MSVRETIDPVVTSAPTAIVETIIEQIAKSESA